MGGLIPNPLFENTLWYLVSPCLLVNVVILNGELMGSDFFVVKDATCEASFLAGSIQFSAVGKILRKSSIK